MPHRLRKIGGALIDGARQIGVLTVHAPAEIRDITPVLALAQAHIRRIHAPTQKRLVTVHAPAQIGVQAVSGAAQAHPPLIGGIGERDAAAVG